MPITQELGGELQDFFEASLVCTVKIQAIKIQNQKAKNHLDWTIIPGRKELDF